MRQRTCRFLLKEVVIHTWPLTGLIFKPESPLPFKIYAQTCATAVNEYLWCAVCPQDFLLRLKMVRSQNISRKLSKADFLETSIHHQNNTSMPFHCTAWLSSRNAIIYVFKTSNSHATSADLSFLVAVAAGAGCWICDANQMLADTQPDKLAH